MMDFKSYFTSKWPEEAVGYVKGGEFFPLENVADDKKHSFEVDPKFMLEAPEVLLHSHTTGFELQSHDARAPSYLDLKGQIATDIEWGICVTDGETCDDPLYWGNPDHRPALLERDFVFNYADCFTLAQDWFYQEQGKFFPNLARDPHWNEDGEDYISELYTKWGFEKVDLAELQLGDVLFYQVRSPVVNHMAIYLGNNEVVGHWYGRVSCVEPFGTWARYIVFAARHKE